MSRRMEQMWMTYRQCNETTWVQQKFYLMPRDLSFAHFAINYYVWIIWSLYINFATSEYNTDKHNITHSNIVAG